MVRISVLICTYNRADYLGGAIESCMGQTLPPEMFEIVVADNDSTDVTREIVNTYRRKNGNIRYVFEPRQGLNVTRNLAAREAAGRYIAYLDDDARADSRWLEHILDSFEQNSPHPVCVGGKIFVDWEGPQPAWFPDELASMHAYLDHGDKGFFLKPGLSGHYLIGTNMAFQRKAILDMGGFRTYLDRMKRRSISGGETEMINRLLRAGMPAYYCPAAIVRHVVVPERRNKKFLISRIKGDGATQPLLDLDNKEFRNVNIFRRILYDSKESLRFLAKSAAYYLRKREKEGFLNFLYAVQKWGRTEMELRFLYDKEFSPHWKQRHQRFTD